MEKNMPDFQRGIKVARKRAGYKTQKVFAEALNNAGIPVTTDTIENWEQGKSLPTMKTFFDLCDFFDCSADHLLSLINEKNHDMQFIHDQTGLSEAAITALQYANSASHKKDPFTLQNQRIIALINLALEKEGNAIEKINSGEKFEFKDLFTLLYDYAFADSKGAAISPARVSFSYDLSFDQLEYDTLPLFREATITAIREELRKLVETKRAAR